MTAGPTGVLLVDKPGGLTSHDVVARVRRLAGTRRVGHAGTLDPMATGLLVLGLGGATRLLTHVVGVDKEYLATIRLGLGTTTDDAEGEPLAAAPAELVAAISEDGVRQGLAALTGDIAQVPSAVSAIKVGGKRAYARVRDGEDVALPARAVTVSEFEALGLRLAPERALLDVDVRVVCSSGTYVRALARDLGARLGVGGHLTALRRTRVGPFTVGDAAELEGLVPAERLLAPAEAASALFPVWRLDAARAVDLGHGKPIPSADAPGPEGPFAALAPDGRLVGLVRRRGDATRVVLNIPVPDGAAPATDER